MERDILIRSQFKRNYRWKHTQRSEYL